ncbi:hypothetical protein [Streptacidiphilus pinicola]|nr:hypothetical protein [Streptacidiphilus pinicola]
MRQVIRPAILAVGLAALAGCSGNPSAPATHAAAGSAAPARPISDTSTPPALDGPGQVLLQAAGRNGSAELGTVPRIQPGTLTLVVACSGPGTITVDLGGIASYSGVDCDGDSPGQYDVMERDSASSQVRVSVRGASSDHWAVTLGWSPTTSPQPTQN